MYPFIGFYREYKISSYFEIGLILLKVAMRSEFWILEIPKLVS